MTVECVRDRGYDFPDPKVDDQRRVTTDPKVKPGDRGPGSRMEKDMNECSEKAGRSGPGGRSTSSEGGA
jgi:hypothetical protein